MSSLPYLEVVGDVAKVGLTLTLILNSLLIYLTIAHIKGIKGTYKFLILLIAVLGIVFSSIEKLLHPFMHSYNVSFVYFTLAPVFGLSKFMRTLLILLYSVLFLMIICVNTIQFVYRYLVIHNSPRVEYFHGRRAVFWIGYLLFFAGAWSYFPLQCLPDEYVIGYLKEELYSEYNADSADVAGFFSVAYEFTGTTRTWRMNAVLGAAGLCSILGLQCSVIVFCAIKIHIRIRETMALSSKKNYQVQSQLFKTLLFQITAPSVFYHVPAFLMFLIPYLDMKISVPSGVMICFFSIYPALDSLILMWIVTEYHRVIGKMMEKFFARALAWAKRFSGTAPNSQVSSSETT